MIDSLTGLRAVVLSFAWVCLCLLSNIVIAAEPKRVLLIQSWAQGTPWSSAIKHGALQGLKQSTQPIELHIENSDLIRLNTHDYAALIEFLKEKYSAYPPDFLLADDDQSADFIMQNREQLFPDVPLIYASPGAREGAQAKAFGKIYRIADATDYLSNLGLIKQLMPQADTLIFIGGAFTAVAQQAISQAAGIAAEQFATVRNLSLEPIEELEAQLAKLPANSAVIVSPYFKDRQDNLLSPYAAIRRISQASAAPLFGNVDQMLELGVVGGKMVSGEGRGRALIDALLRLMAGQAVSQEAQQRYMFNYRALQRWGLDNAELPVGSVVTHRPAQLYETNPIVFFAALAAISVLLLVVAFLLVMYGLRQRANQDLLKREQRYRVLYEDNPFPMLVYELGSLNVLTVNQAFERDFGYSRKAIYGKSVVALVAEESRDALLADIRQIDPCQPGSLSSRWQVFRSNGEQVEVEITEQTIEFDSRRARMVSFYDATEQLEAEAALRLSELRLNQIVESCPVATFALDAEYKVTHWNFAAELLTHIPASTMVGKRHNLGQLVGYGKNTPLLVESLLRGQSLQDFKQSATFTAKGSSFVSEGLESEALVPFLGNRWLHNVAVPLRAADGALLGGMQMTLDITELKHSSLALEALNAELEQRVEQRTSDLALANADLQRAMQQLVHSEKLAALGGLVAGVAHELNTPLGNMLTVVTTLRARLHQLEQDVLANRLRRSLLDDFLLSAGQASHLLERNVNRAAELVASFKQLAVDQTSVRRRSFILAQALAETLRTLTPQYKHEPIEVNLHIDPALTLDSFPGPLEQVMAQLLNNAVLHARGDAPHLQITVSAQSVVLDGQPAVSIEVRDDGIGMDAETANKVFDPFFTTRFGQGRSGLGLYVVHTLVTGVLGGLISLESSVGIGSCFTLHIPLQAPEQAIVS